MKIRGREILIVDHRPNEPWPRSICVDGERMDYNNIWESTASGARIYYKSPDDKSIFQGIGILKKDLMRVINAKGGLT